MKPIRVALFHRDDWYRGEPRIDGLFSYDVPQFEVHHYPVAKGFQQDLHGLRGLHDVVFWDDGKYKDYAGFTPEEHTGYLPPVVVYSLYPTLTRGHFARRVERAQKNADLVLVDHDDLTVWQTAMGKVPVRRMGYATNERYYRDKGLVRDIDVGFYCVYGWNKERPALSRWLRMYCGLKGWNFMDTSGLNVGTLYSQLLARTKCVLHLNRTAATRPPRVFDSAASGCCYVGNPLPSVSGEKFIAGEHYLEFGWPRSEVYEEFTPAQVPVYSDADCAQVAKVLDLALDGGEWEKIACRAKSYVLSCHTWAYRAVELFGVLCDVFPQLRKGRDEWMFL